MSSGIYKNLPDSKIGPLLYVIHVTLPGLLGYIDRLIHSPHDDFDE